MYLMTNIEIINQSTLFSKSIKIIVNRCTFFYEDSKYIIQISTGRLITNIINQSFMITMVTLLNE